MLVKLRQWKWFLKKSNDGPEVGTSTRRGKEEEEEIIQISEVNVSEFTNGNAITSYVNSY